MRRPVDNRPGTADMRARKHVRSHTQAATVLRVSEWPRDKFFELYDELARRSAFAHDGAVADAAGISASMISRWRSGKAKPARESLSKLAKAFGVSGMELWEAAGIIEAGTLEKLGFAEMIAARQDVTVEGTPGVLVLGRPPIPPELSRLAELLPQLPGDARQTLGMQLQLLAQWAEAQLERVDP